MYGNYLPSPILFDAELEQRMIRTNMVYVSPYSNSNYPSSTVSIAQYSTVITVLLIKLTSTSIN